METLSFLPIGGVGDVTKNMYVYEYAGQILVVDCGIGFPPPSLPGVDLVIPDVSYLIKNKHKIKGMLLTHGHEDHIGALPYVLDLLPQFPMYGAKLTAALANAKLVEFGIHREVETVDFQQKLTIGPFSISLVHVTHSVLDTTHYIIETPAGRFYHGSDFKFDPTPADGKITEKEKIIEAGKKGITCLFVDALRVEKEGRTPSEQMIEENFEREIKNCPGQFIVTTYSSNISRLNQAIRVGQKYGRRICFVGRSLKNAKEVAEKLGYLDLKPGDEVKYEELKHLPRNRVMLLIAGSQGQLNSSLNRVANDQDKFIKIFEDDVVIFSADPIPGNEIFVHALIDTLSKKGARVVYSEINDDMHVSGHAAKEDIREMIQMTHPRFIFPIGAMPRQMVQLRLLGRELNYKKEDVFIPENGQEILFSKDKATLGKKITPRNIYVDEITGEEIHHFVIRDRQKLSEDGIVVVLVEMDAQGVVVGDPDVITRGFGTKDDKWIVGEIKKQIRKGVLRNKTQVVDWMQVRKMLEERIERFILQKARRRPLVLPIVIEV